MTEQRERARIPVTWFEMFYDLVTVAVLVSMNDSFLVDPGLGTSLLASAAAAALFTVWLLTTLSVNRFPGDWSARRGIILTQMAAMVVLALAVDRDYGLHESLALVALSACLLTVAALYWHAPSRHGGRPSASRVAVISLSAAALVPLLAVPLPRLPWATVAFAVTGLVAVVPLLLWYAPAVEDRHPLEPQHLGERLGQFTLLVLGLGFGQLVVDLSGTQAVTDVRFFVLTFVLMFTLWWLYFAFDVQERAPTGRRTSLLWVLAHYLLLIGIVGVTDVLTALAASGGGEPLHVGEAFLGLTGFMTMVGLAMLLSSVDGMGRAAAGLLVFMAVVVLAYGVALELSGAHDLRVIAVVSVAAPALAAIVLGRLRHRRALR